MCARARGGRADLDEGVREEGAQHGAEVRDAGALHHHAVEVPERVDLAGGSAGKIDREMRSTLGERKRHCLGHSPERGAHLDETWPLGH